MSVGLCVAALQVPVLPRDTCSFHCSLPRLMPLSAIDPSLAIGFYCANTGVCVCCMYMCCMCGCVCRLWRRSLA